MKKLVSWNDVRNQMIELMKEVEVSGDKEVINNILANYDLKLNNENRCGSINSVNKIDVLKEVLFLLNLEIRNKDYSVYLSSYTNDINTFEVDVVKKEKVNVSSYDYDFIFTRDDGVLYIPYEDDVVSKFGSIVSEDDKKKILKHRGIIVPNACFSNNWCDGGDVIKPYLYSYDNLVYLDDVKKTIEDYEVKLNNYINNWCKNSSIYKERVDNLFVLKTTFSFKIIKDFNGNDLNDLLNEIFNIFEFLI